MAAPSWTAAPAAYEQSLFVPDFSFFERRSFRRNVRFVSLCRLGLFRRSLRLDLHRFIGDEFYRFIQAFVARLNQSPIRLSAQP